MADKMHSIKELADANHVSKSAIRKLMTTEFREKYTHPDGNRILIDDAGVAQIKSHFAHSGANRNASNTCTEREPETANRVQGEHGADNKGTSARTDDLLDEKDKRIADLQSQLKTKDEQIAQLHRLMDQNQQLLLAEQAKQHPLIEQKAQGPKPTQEAKDDNPESKKGFWQRLFG